MVVNGSWVPSAFTDSKLYGCPLQQYTDITILFRIGWYSMPTGVLKAVEIRWSVKFGLGFG